MCKLMNRSQSSNNGITIHDNMSRQSHIICQNTAISDNHVMSNMNVSHQQVSTSYSRFPTIIRSTMNRYKLTNGISDRKSTRLNSSHANISYAVFCLKKKTKQLN